MLRLPLWLGIPIRICLVVVALLAGPAGTAHAADKPPAPKAPQALLVTHPFGIALISKNAAQRMAPSSMTKLMTALLVIEAIKSGKVKETEIIRMPRAATRTRGSRLRLRAGARISIRDLLVAMVVGSANDAAKALAIRMAGTEAAFAALMTIRAKQLGLAESQFVNATGFNAEGHHMSARDVAVLSAHLIHKHPKFYAMFSRRSVRVGKRRLRNRNPVLGRVKGADGIKTGQTRKGGYGLVASARRGKVRLILVINGLRSAAARRREAERLLKWGFGHLKR